MVGVGCVVAKLDRLVGEIHVLLTVEAWVEGADEGAGRIVDGGGEPALAVVAQLGAEVVVADDAAQRRDDIDEHQRKYDVGDGCREQVTQRADLGVEDDTLGDDAQGHNGQRERQLQSTCQHSNRM